MATDNKDNITMLPETVHDDYTASIELSNACREFYRKRVKTTENFKQNLGSLQPPTRRTSIDDAMDKLKSEMVSIFTL